MRAQRRGGAERLSSERVRRGDMAVAGQAVEGRLRLVEIIQPLDRRRRSQECALGVAQRGLRLRSQAIAGGKGGVDIARAGQHPRVADVRGRHGGLRGSPRGQEPDIVRAIVQIAGQEERPVACVGAPAIELADDAAVGVQHPLQVAGRGDEAGVGKFHHAVEGRRAGDVEQRRGAFGCLPPRMAPATRRSDPACSRRKCRHRRRLRTSACASAGSKTPLLTTSPTMSPRDFEHGAFRNADVGEQRSAQQRSRAVLDGHAAVEADVATQVQRAIALFGQ